MGYDDLLQRKRLVLRPAKTEEHLGICSGDRIVLDDESAKINEQANNLNNDEAKNASEVVSNTYFGDNGEVQGFEHQHGESNDKEESSDPFQYHPIYLTNALKEVRTTDTSSSILYPPGLGRAMELILRSLKEAENPWTSLFESFSNGLSFKEDGSILEILEEMIYGGSNQWLFMEVLFLAFRLPVWYSTSQTTGLFYLRKFFSDFGPTPFRFYHSWLELLGFDDLVSKSWNSFTLDDSYGMIWFKKKLQILKKEIRAWISRRIRLAVRNGLLFMEVLYWMQNSSFVGPRPKVLIYVQTASFLLDRLMILLDGIILMMFSSLLDSVLNAFIGFWNTLTAFLHGLNGHVLSAAFNSTWSSIITEVNSLKVKGVDLISHCKIRVGKGTSTSFWKDLWIGDNLLKLFFPRLFALEENKDISVADKMNTSISSSFRRHVRGGVESQQLDQLSLLLDTVILSNMDDRWFWDLNGDGVFQVKDVRSMLDEAFLPKMEVPTRWIKSIPIKVNVFAWKLYLDRLPTRSNLSRRNVSLPSLACPLCDHVLEDSSHLFFGCSVAKDIQKLICRWWNLDVHPYESYEY
ncbi:RNA-directed DNA polymerase, eukaryota [Tanacetum coccineum]